MKAIQMLSAFIHFIKHSSLVLHNLIIDVHINGDI